MIIPTTSTDPAVQVKAMPPDLAVMRASGAPVALRRIE